MQWSPQQDKALVEFRNWFDENRGKPSVFRLFGFAGTGKEQPVSCVVQTPEGPRKMGDLCVGDRVFGRDGSVQTVLGIYPQGRKPVYRVTFRDGSSTRCGEDHLWQVRCQKWTKVLPLKDLIRRGLWNNAGDAKYEIPLCEPVRYEAPEPRFDPYLIGALIGDGYLSGNVVALCCPDGEDEKGGVVDRVRLALPDGFEIRTDRSPACPRHTLVDTTAGRCNRLKRHLVELGLDVKSTDRFIPDEYLRSKVQARFDLLRGLMDTDGCATGNRIRFSSKSARLARDIRTLVQSLGGTAIVKQANRGERGIEYAVNVKMLVNPFHAQRKACLWSPSWKNPPSRKFHSIVLEGEEDQVCIKVSSSDELYLTDDFIVTHNTTLATHLAQDVDGPVSFLAYTGKAAQVLRTKGCPTASTIHSAAYVSKTKSRRKLLDLERQLETAPDQDAYEWLQDRIAEEREQLRQPAFALNAESKLRHSALIVLDEVSMVDRRIGHDLLSFGVPILAMGDPAQLPPVKGSCFVSFERPEVMLTEIHRTALDNPVLYLASRAREGESIDPGSYGDSRVCWAKDLERGVSLQHDQTIVGKNATRRAGNARVRFMLGRTSPFPQEGDRIICLRNDHEAGLLNGMIFETLSCEDNDGTLLVSARPDGGGPDVEFDAHPEVFLGRDLHPWARLDKQEFDYGYVITAHKSQGSEWSRVMVIDESAIFRGERFRWLYTALTRARDSVTLVRK